MRRSYRWLVGTVAAAAVLTPVCYAGWAVSSWDGRPGAADCEEVMAFAGGKLPAQATGVHCTDNGGWQDRGYLAEFRMPREELAQRLTTAFPRVRVTGDGAKGLDFGDALGPQAKPPGGQAMTVRLRAVYDGDGTALVKLEAFDV
ncbi:hypothetical protein ACIRD3_28585 [Kitasatospora sp. NPDC093550]|uniref:hypothetical protein n=1 Tax=Kitasatospora sp. NPDC093550 TaxID=3364089 RepID=UPI00382A8F05